MNSTEIFNARIIEGVNVNIYYEREVNTMCPYMITPCPYMISIKRNKPTVIYFK